MTDSHRDGAYLAVRMQAAPGVSVVAIIEQMPVGLADHETKVADTLAEAGCEDTAPSSDTVKHLHDDAGGPTGRALALEAAIASGGLSQQVLVCTHSCIMYLALQNSAVAVFSDR